MRKSIYKIFAAAFAIIFMTGMAYGATDTSGHWAENTINQWIHRGYIQGYEDGSFKPNNPITRAEFTALTDRAFNKSGQTSVNFSDVGQSDWFYRAVSRGVSAGYISGYDDGTFKPGNNITRQEAAVIIARVLGEGQNQQYAGSFSDSNLLSWSKGYVGKCVELGILKGDTSGAFRPEDNMTRAEAVTALNNALNYYNSKLSYVPDNEGIVKNEDSEEIIESGTTNISSAAFGPSSGKQTLTEKVKITNSSASTRIKNVTFEDTVTVTESVNKLYLENVTADKLVVNGTTNIYLTNCDIKTIEVDAPKAVTIENTSRSSVNEALLYSAATLNDKYASSSYGFNNVKIDSSVSKNTNFSLTGGTFNDVTINAEGARMNLRSGTIRNLYLTSNAKNAYVSLSKDTTVSYAEILGRSSSVVGDGRITKAYVNASGVTLSRRPNTLTGNYTPDYDSNSSGNSSNNGRYSYTFKVVNSNGYPVRGADVRVDGTTYTTSTSGEVTFRLNSGRYDYRITHTDFSTKTGTITASNSSGNFSLSGGNKYSVTVNVKDDSGNAVEGAYVRIGNNTGNTNANGSVTLNNVESGYYSVSATKTNYTPYSDNLEVSKSSTKTLNATMKDNTVKTGAATITVNKDKDVSGISGGMLSYTGAANGNIPFTFGKAVTIPNLAPGAYKFTASAKNYNDNFVDVTVTSGQTAQKSIALSRAVFETVNVTVNVKDADKAAINGASVTLSEAKGPEDTVDGAVIFNDVTPGTYQLKIEKEEYVTIDKEITVVDYLQNQPFEFTMEEKEPEPVPPVVGTLKVTVKDEDGVLDGASVQVTGNGMDTTQSTDENGNADFENLELNQKYTITVSKEGYITQTIEDYEFNSEEPVNVTLEADEEPIGAPLTQEVLSEADVPENVEEGEVPSEQDNPDAEKTPEKPQFERPVVLPADELPGMQEQPKELETNTEPADEVPVKEEPKTEEPKEEAALNLNSLVPVNSLVKEEQPAVQANDKKGNESQAEQKQPEIKTGSIRISISGPQSAVVSIAGRSITVNGTATLNNIPAGTYSYSAWAEGYSSSGGSVTVSPGNGNSVHINLSKQAQIETEKPIHMNSDSSPGLNSEAENNNE